MQILVIDNYDSFVFNVVQYLSQLGATVSVWRNDDPQLTHLPGVIRHFDGVVLSPGPGAPQEAGKSLEVVHACVETHHPLLGICLGHQTIGMAFGATIGRSPELLHGKTSKIFHNNHGIFTGIPNPFIATRYHSLAILDRHLPASLEMSAHTDNEIIMAIQHRELPIYGVQFHPESILTEGGYRLLANWLAICGEPFNEDLVNHLEHQIATTVHNIRSITG